MNGASRSIHPGDRVVDCGTVLGDTAVAAVDGVLLVLLLCEVNGFSRHRLCRRRGPSSDQDQQGQHNDEFLGEAVVFGSTVKNRLSATNFAAAVAIPSH